MNINTNLSIISLTVLLMSFTSFPNDFHNTAPIAPPPALCEQFETNDFPPAGWTSDGSWWAYNIVSGFGTGTGSARFNSWNAPAGTDNNLVTLTFETLPDAELIFDIAYSPYPPGQPYYQDSLVVLASTDEGASFFSVARLGPLEMQTAPASGSEFTPISSEWGKLTYPLPAGVNKIDFLGRSRYGNNIFIDSICINHLTGIAQNETGAPKIFSLSQNYPNPFNPSTVINFSIPKSAIVTLNVYDILGRNAATLIKSELKQSGYYRIIFNASNLSSGIYFYEMVAKETAHPENKFSYVRKMLLVK